MSYKTHDAVSPRWQAVMHEDSVTGINIISQVAKKCNVVKIQNKFNVVEYMYDVNI